MADLFTYPNAPGAQNRDTSRAAADHVPERAPVLRARVPAVIERSNGLTADEEAGRLGVSILSVRPRVTELARLHKVRDSGQRPRKIGQANIFNPVTNAHNLFPLILEKHNNHIY